MTINDIIQRTVARVTRDGQEVDWFANEKDAAAYVQHVYGLSVYDLIGHPSIEIKGFGDREPESGDLVKTAQGLGVLCFGHVVVNARTFRAGPRVSCSGGPCVPVDTSKLVFVGLERTRFWRWADGYPAAHNGGDYSATVPVWEARK